MLYQRSHSNHSCPRHNVESPSRPNFPAHSHRMVQIVKEGRLNLTPPRRRLFQCFTHRHMSSLDCTADLHAQSASPTQSLGPYRPRINSAPFEWLSKRTELCSLASVKPASVGTLFPGERVLRSRPVADRRSLQRRGSSKTLDDATAWRPSFWGQKRKL